ncbi:MAG TPA: hypothetical protein VFX02_01565 [Gammaproteobacteria bacterium]|nr:hypothetical protein [Gammaproteobacteria bacterium]
MPADTTSVLQSLLFDSMVIAFFVFGVLAGMAGVGLIVCRDKALRLFVLLNRHISTRQALKSASVPHDIGPTVKRYHWWFAGIIIAGAAYSLYILLARFNASLVTTAIAGGQPDLMAQFIVEVLRWFMVVFSAIACIIGILLGLSPQALQGIEARANRWYSMRKATAPLEIHHFAVDRWVEAHPLIAGWCITIGALIVAISSGIILFGK